MKPRTADNIVIVAVLALLCTTAISTAVAVHYREAAGQAYLTCPAAKIPTTQPRRIKT
jgi:hypothetical protein